MNRFSPVIYRVVQVITLMIAAVFAVSGFLGLRELAWRHDAQVNAQILSGLVVTLIGVGVPGVLYVLLGGRVLRVVPIDLIQVQMGALVGTLLYGVYNVITPLSAESARFDVGRRLLTGALDGLLIGVVIGAIVMVISARPLDFRRADLVRFGGLFIAVLGVAWFIVVFSTAINMSDALALAITLLALLLLKLAVMQYDRRHPELDADD